MKFLTLLLLLSCANIKQREYERDIQTHSLKQIKARKIEFAGCARKSQLHRKLKNDRIRVQISLLINEFGELERFELDKAYDYPISFSDCMFDILDKIQFKKLKTNSELRLNQSFIFQK